MLSEETKAVIRRKVEFMRNSHRQMSAAGQKPPESLTMLIFDSQGDYENFYDTGERLGDSYLYFNEAAEAVKQGLEEVGISAHLEIAHWDEYAKWLAGRKHTMYTRVDYAVYVGATKVVGKDKIKGPTYN